MTVFLSVFITHKENNIMKEKQRAPIDEFRNTQQVTFIIL